ncbi:MAG: arsenic resistance N-acetyltransferase ArsN2 [Gammaproteobacteria bacterium]|nr:arsenic resistance N-acetyltransferase ArsN2 [Gammaproteobacteria bacterium]MDH3469358.1 arsenic resistance N-acetyltransferase ArsN2 [Gammaproteobacteria bacterium]
MSRNDIEIIPAATMMAECQNLLRAANLPYSDIEPHLQTFFLARRIETVIGVAGFEHYGDVALLRSVAVAESVRGLGIGRQLCDACCSYASALGIRSLYLLTETAADYFATMGFQEIPRNNAPPSIQNTNEFREFCPTSAVLMTRQMSKRFLRVIRLDESDTHVYDRVARPGEWAVTGSFAFLDDGPDSLSGKRLQSFRTGFLGTDSLGWGTVAEVTEINELEYRRVVELLATQFVAHFGAPNMEQAAPMAEQEAAYTASLCEHPLHTLMAIQRKFSDDGIVENLRVVRPSAAGHDDLRLWAPDES